MPHRLDNLVVERLNAGLSVQGLAQKANTSDWVIRQLEVGGTCDKDTAQRIADALGVSLATLGIGDL